MIEGNAAIVLAGDDALGYLAGQTHKKYSIAFILGPQGFGRENSLALHLVRLDIMTDFLILPTAPLVHTSTHLEYPRLLRM